MALQRAANSVEFDVGIDLRQRQIDAKRGYADAGIRASDDIGAKIVRRALGIDPSFDLVLRENDIAAFIVAVAALLNVWPCKKKIRVKS